MGFFKVFLLERKKKKETCNSFFRISSTSLSHVKCNTVVAVFSNCAKLPASVFTALLV